jgi:hypothetical protein
MEKRVVVAAVSDLALIIGDPQTKFAHDGITAIIII